MYATAEALSVGAAVQKVRIKKGLTQKQLAQATGLKENYVAQIEGGHRCPSQPTLLSICEALQVPASFIYCLADESDNPIAVKCRELVEKSLQISSEEHARKN